MNKFTYSESLQFGRLSDTFSKNFRLTRLYATYLERFPEAISAEMIGLITEGTEISEKEAIVAILSELFALDPDKNPEDKALIRDYISRSVRILDAKKYENDPYYKNVKLKNEILGSWEIRNEAYEPYRAVICHDMIINDDFSEVPPLGFFTERFEFPAVLEGGNEWMTLTPVDLDTCEDAIEKARGRVVTFGLGLGYYCYMAALKDSVESVTVVERSPEVIELFKKRILPQFPNPEKVIIVNKDAIEYMEKDMPKENFDFAFADIWRDASDGAPIYKKMKPLEKLSPTTEFAYWIENFLISRLRAQRFYEISEAHKKGQINASFSEVIESLSIEKLTTP